MPATMGKSFNGRITGLHPVDVGSIPTFFTRVRHAVVAERLGTGLKPR